MRAQTKYFGEVDIDESKVLEFPNGIIGFENLTKYAIIYDIERGEDVNVSYLQSLEEPLLVLPVMSPLVVLDEYNPMIEDELLKPIGMPTDDEMMVLLSFAVPADLTKMTVNMKAPFVINTKTKQGAQVIVENTDYAIKFPVYDILQQKKEKAGE